jgi:hypothetical protein
MSNKRTLHVALAAFSSLAAIQAGTARANPIVLNGDFSANASAFSSSGGLGAVAIDDWDNYGGTSGVNGVDTGGPFTTYGPTDQQTSPTLDWAVLESPGAPIVQDIPVTGGATYTVSYEDATESRQNGGALQVITDDGDFGTTTGYHVTYPGDVSFQPESFTFTAGVGQTQETMIVQSAGSVPVDATDIVVVQTPEPASIALLNDLARVRAIVSAAFAMKY